MKPSSKLLLLFLGLLLPGLSIGNELEWIPAWQQTASLGSQRAGMAALEVNGVMYVMGGIDGKRFLSSTEMSSIQADGSVAPWRQGASLTEPRGFLGVARHKGFIYVVGGANGANGQQLLNSVERAPILSDGSLGPWQREQHTLNYPRRCVKVVLLGGYLYALGGYAGQLLDSVERAKILADGHLGPWQLLSDSLTLPRYVHAVKHHGDAIYILGGHNEERGRGYGEVEWSRLNAQGELQAWRQAHPLQMGRYALSAAVHDGHLYALGGLDGAGYFDSIEKTRLTPLGTTQAWQDTTPLSTRRATFATVVYQDWIYVLGGTNSDGYYDSVEYATINPQGDIGFLATPRQAKAYYDGLDTVSVRTKISLPHNGVVREVFDTDNYTYLNVEGQHGGEWIAAARSEVKVNDQIRYSHGVTLSDFHSKSLGRTFASVRLVGKIERVSEQ